MNTLSNYQCYNTKYERLAIFCEVMEGGLLDITVIPCNKNDQFSRKKAKMYYFLSRQLTPVKGMSRIVIDVKDNKPKNTFLIFCKESFLRVKTVEHTIPDHIAIHSVNRGDKNNFTVKYFV